MCPTAWGWCPARCSGPSGIGTSWPGRGLGCGGSGWPPGAFSAVVPVLIVLSLVLVVAQPWLARRLAARREEDTATAAEERPDSWWLWLAILGTGIYGGYFGAAQGVPLLGLM